MFLSSKKALLDVPQVAENILRHYPILCDRIRQKCEIQEGHERLAFTELIKFLDVNAQTLLKRTPSLVVDAMWHEFILFTKLYDSFCDQRYGRFIHHQPGGSRQENQRQYCETLEDIQRVFGTLNETYWPIPSFMSVDVSCGSCD